MTTINYTALNKMNVSELRLECKKAGLCRYSKLRKSELIECLMSPKIENMSVATLKRRCKDLGLSSFGPKNFLITSILSATAIQLLPDEIIAHIGSFCVGTYALSSFAVLSRSVWSYMPLALKRHQIALGVMRVGKPGERATRWLFDYQETQEVDIAMWRAYIKADYTRIIISPPHLVHDEEIAVSVLSKKTSGGYYHKFPEPKSHRVRLAAISHNARMLAHVPPKDVTDELLLAACTQRSTIIHSYRDMYKQRTSDPTFLAKLIEISPLPDFSVTVYKLLDENMADRRESVPESLYAETLLRDVHSGVTHNQLLAALVQNHTTLRSHHKLYSDVLSDKTFLDMLYKRMPDIKSLYPDLLDA